MEAILFVNVIDGGHFFRSELQQLTSKVWSTKGLRIYPRETYGYVCSHSIDVGTLRDDDCPPLNSPRESHLSGSGAMGICDLSNVGILEKDGIGLSYYETR